MHIFNSKWGAVIILAALWHGRDLQLLLIASQQVATIYHNIRYDVMDSIMAMLPVRESLDWFGPFKWRIDCIGWALTLQSATAQRKSGNLRQLQFCSLTEAGTPLVGIRAI